MKNIHNIGIVGNGFVASTVANDIHKAEEITAGKGCYCDRFRDESVNNMIFCDSCDNREAHDEYIKLKTKKYELYRKS